MKNFYQIICVCQKKVVSLHYQIKNDMNYILKTDIKDFDALIAELKKRYLVRCEHSCNKRNAFGIATYFSGEVREFIFLSKKMCCSEPMVSWITSRKRCVSEDEFLSEIDAKILKQIENRKTKNKVICQ